LVFPIAIVFAILGRHFPAQAVAQFVGMVAFGPRLERVTGWLLSVIPVRPPARIAYRNRLWPGAVWLVA
jgi:amino acid efflux transporter